MRGRWGCNELKACDSYRGTSSSIRAFLLEDWEGWRGGGRGLTGFPPQGSEASSYSVPHSSGPCGRVWGGSQPRLPSSFFCLLLGIPGVSQKDSPFLGGLPSTLPED